MAPRFPARILLGTAVSQVVALWTYILVNKRNLHQNLSVNLENKKIQDQFSYGVTKRKVAIVEQHHEVIPYWLEAAQNDHIGKTANTLIHIDGHQDGFPPPYTIDFPFRWPEKLTTAVYESMMKANDVFILSAVGMELIDTFIWIKPSWADGNYENRSTVIGLTDKFKDSYGTQLCLCGEPGDEPKRRKNSIRKQQKCMVIHPKRKSLKTIHYSDCLIKTKFRYYAVSEKYAIKLLTAIRKIEGNRPKVILDIDEDYFGVENRTKEYGKIGGRADDISIIDETTSEVFCPKTGGKTENVANEFMLKYIKNILTQCHSGQQKCTKEEVFEIGKMLRKELDKSLGDKIFCRKDDQGELSSLAYALWLFSKNTLKGLLKLKFCNFGIPSLDLPIRFQTCKGIPNNGGNAYHMPNKAEEWDRANRLRSILSFIFTKYEAPGIITVCRSVRDGYTPLSYFSSIEKHIIDALRYASVPNDDLNFHYDDKLLFGSSGWITE